MQAQSLSRFARNLRGEWRKLGLQTDNQTLIVAVSGGADSCAMLLALQELTQAKKFLSKIIVAHFNHSLRGAASDSDADFVMDLAAKLDLQCVCGVQDSQFKIQNMRGNLEQSARRARYDFLRETAENNNAYAVLTAHTLNDQAETFLMNLIRGSGADGLSAMKAVRELKYENVNRESQTSNRKIWLIRPLLSWARREMTEDYCRERDVDFRHDAMNDDLDFSRVRVRKQLLPLLGTFNPRIVENLAQTAATLRQDSAELNSNAENLLKVFVTIEQSLDVSTFAEQSSAIRIRVLRLWLKSLRGNLRRIDLKHLKSLEKLALTGENNKRIELPNGETVLRSQSLLNFISPES